MIRRFVEMLGADEVIVDFRTDFRDFLYDYDYDAVFDIIGGETCAKSFQGGIIVSMLEQPNAEIMERHGTKAISQSTQVNSERLTKLAQCADQNNTNLNLGSRFHLKNLVKRLIT
jgi:alcohol dehydrogenase